MLKNKVNLTLIVICFSSLLINSCSFLKPSNNIKDLTWLCGTWQGSNNDQLFFQEWRLIDDSILVGLNYSVCNREKYINDSSIIKFVDGNLIYESNNANWKLEFSSDSACKFSNEKFSEAIYLNRAKNHLHTKFDFLSQKIEFELIATEKNTFTGNKKFIVGQYDGYFKFNSKKQFLTIDFDTLNGVQQANITSDKNFIFNKSINSICFNDPILTLNFQDINQAIRLKLKLADSTLTGTIKFKKTADVYLRNNNQTISTNKEIEQSNKIKNTKIAPLEISIFKPKNHEINSVVILLSNQAEDNYFGWAKEYAKNNIELIICKNLANSLNFKEDLEVLINYIKSTSQSKFKIGLIDISSTFNEGLTNAANNKELDFYVSISNQFISNREKILEDAKLNLNKNNFDQSYLNAANDVWNALFEYATKRSNREIIINMLRQADTEGWGKYCLPAKIPSDEELNNSPFWKSINDDPTISLNKLAIPTLVIYGEHDKFINVKLNAERINQIFKSKPNLLSIRIYGNADHYLKSSNHAENLWPTYDEDFMKQTMQWISNTSK